MSPAIVPIALAIPSPILRRVFSLEYTLQRMQPTPDAAANLPPWLMCAACALCLGYPCPDGDLRAIGQQFEATMAPGLHAQGQLSDLARHAVTLCLFALPAAPAAPEPPAQTEAQGTAPPSSGGAHPHQGPLPEPPPGASAALVRMYHAATRSRLPAERAIYLQALADHATQEG